MELKVENLTKRFGEVVAVEDASFEAERGGFVTLLGQSGSGKTTLLRCIAGVETPDAGVIEIGGKVVFSKERNVTVPSEKRGIGMVYQSYALWPHMTVFENVAYPLKIRGTKNEIDERVGRMLGTLKIGDLKQRYPYQLSGGEQQRVALARALVYDPALLLLDEPFSNLDTPLRERLRDELKMVQQELGITTVYVTHHRVEASSMSDVIVILSHGRVSATGAPSELLEHPPNPYVASFLGELLVLEGTGRLSSEGRLEVETSAGLLELYPGGASEVGEGITIYVKPGLTKLVKEGGKPNRLKGRIVGIIRETSNRLEYHVEIGDQIIKVPHEDLDWAPAIRDTVFVEVLPGGYIRARK